MRIAAVLLAARVAAAALPLPTAPQLRWQTGSGIMALIHFNMATFFQDGDPGCTSSNWLGENGSGNPNSFAPSALNVSQWVDSMVAIGVDEAVLTAKHGCGFYLWPTKVRLPDGSPYAYHVNETSYGDVLEQFRDATSARNIGHGFYYSLTNNRYLNVYGHSVQPGPLQPGQVNVTQQEFEDIAFDSVSELWQNYGALTEIWVRTAGRSAFHPALVALPASPNPSLELSPLCPSDSSTAATRQTWRRA